MLSVVNAMNNIAIPRDLRDRIERRVGVKRDVAKKIGDLGFQSTLYTNLGVALCTFHVRCDREGVEAVKKSIELDRRLNLIDHLPMPLIALGQLYQCHGQMRQTLDTLCLLYTSDAADE